MYVYHMTNKRGRHGFVVILPSLAIQLTRRILQNVVRVDKQLSRRKKYDICKFRTKPKFLVCDSSVLQPYRGIWS